ncbi:MAG TPA: 3-ketoacyl-ACP reductase [Pirellulales bacterium]|jgi:NAD(P)-dependent dehydrogenase (short-subunit alcohol dehydrogenase family)|nr:3-ketoacyl-ACP reductase [Pirellulales bacterium]
MPLSALVTGSSRGIGRAIAREMARAGYAVGVNYASRADSAEKVVEEIVDSGGQAVALKGDVGFAADRTALVEAMLGQFGRLDVLVNNAGITSPGRKDLLEATEASWDQVFNTNLKGPFFLTQLAANKMVELIRAGKMPGGKIINISSISAFAVSTDRGDYCLTKAALPMLTQLFAVRLAEEKIGVFEICPGIIESDMTAAVKEKYDRLISGGLTPIRRWGRPEDVAQAVSAIVADVFPFSTGERIHVDGGFHIRRL